MSSGPKQKKTLESAISFTLVGILFLIGIGILLKQSYVDMNRFGLESGGSILPDKKQGDAQPWKPAFEIPAPDKYKTLSPTKIYGEENLYEKIDGKADFYIDSGFKKLLTRRFVSREREDWSMELYLYDMGNVRNAFSVLSLQRRPDADIISIFLPSYGYRTSNGLFFVHGKYYVELIGSCQSRELLKAIIETAQKILGNLAVDGTGIPELTLFPRENLILGSIKFYPADAFGFAGLTDTFSAEYEIDTETITAFLSRRSSRQDAKNVAQSYYKFLLDNGGVDKTAGFDDFSIGYAKVVDFYGSIEIVFSNGEYVAGIHEAESVTGAQRVAAMLDARLNEVQKQ